MKPIAVVVGNPKPASRTLRAAVTVADELAKATGAPMTSSSTCGPWSLSWARLFRRAGSTITEPEFDDLDTAVDHLAGAALPLIQVASAGRPR